MKILLALTDKTNLEVISALLISEGNELVLASDGNEVLIAMSEQPDVALIDANLTAISGYECCRQLKHDEKNHHRVIVMLIPDQDAAAWARFSECGADDFIQYPLHPNVIKAKIRQLLHLKELQQRLDASHRHVEQEIRLAKHMFDSITKRQPQEVDYLDYWSLSAGHFCGDLFIFERTPENHLHICLADFTGHGLAAAMGALPVSDIFFAMTRKGSGLDQIVSEVNRKLYELLPTGKFCAATFLRLEADYSKLELWNGGLPPVLLTNRQNAIVKKYESFHLPLGIADSSDFDSQTSQFDLNGIKSIVLYSDGLIEASNSLGEYYGEEKLAQIITSNAKERSIFNKIKSSTLSFLEGLEPHDDISLTVININ